MGMVSLIGHILLAASVTPAPVRSDQPYPVSFPAQDARFVRLVIYENTSAAPCIDELEIYGPDDKKNLALATTGAKATASSCLSGYTKHAIKHLNDGRYGNDYSWIPATDTPEWAQIELPEITRVAKIVFSRDRLRQYADRVPVHFEVQLSNDGERFATVTEVKTTAAAVAVRARSGGFAGVVPNPPPPPRIGRQGKIEASLIRADIKVPKADDVGFTNLALNPDAKPKASSLLPGHAIHQVAHLNDGLAGNTHSWISQEDPSWAEIDLGDVYWIYHVAFGSDSSQQYGDRAAVAFRILTATEYDEDSAGSAWNVVHRQSGGRPVHVRRSLMFQPVQARWVRIAIDASNQSQVRIDELEVFGQKDPIPIERIGALLAGRVVQAQSDIDEQLRYAFVAEEHAWLKTYGRADLSSRLIETAYRDKVHPAHVGADRLPLPPLAHEPILDGHVDDACWTHASRGVVRVADPYDFDRGPLATYAAFAGHRDGQLHLAIRTNRLLSSHVAVVSCTNGGGCGVVVITKDGLVFNQYSREGRSGAMLEKSTPLEGAFDGELASVECRLPLDSLPDCRELGIRVGLGMGGRHTKPEGRPVEFFFSPLAIAETSPCVNGQFQVRMSLAADAEPMRVDANVARLTEGVALEPGESTTLSVPARQGPIGPEYDLEIHDSSGEIHSLRLFRYDALARTLALFEDMIDRFETKGRDVDAERQQLAHLRELHRKLQAAAPDIESEREAFFQARLAKRQLFLREPDLKPIERILFVKRQAFRPSHNYSVLLDARWRPGGGVCLLDIPRENGRFTPGKAAVTQLFDAGQGIARNPMADFDCGKIYFAHRASEAEYFDIMAMKTDGSDLERLTFGPFHDYWPCPLPDGGLAFISTRCRARFLCWRPQAAVLFRMDADGENIRPLSYANLTEWGPSVMSDGRIIWQRSEYQDKGADFSHTLWAIRPDGTKAELVFGNTIMLPQGYANGREVPGTNEICSTLISHFGDLNGPIALLDVDRGRFNPDAITSITPEVPWPGMWPINECFRDPFPLATDYFLVSHAPRDRFGLYVIDRYGNREILYMDQTVGSMAPTPFRVVPAPPALDSSIDRQLAAEDLGQFMLSDVYQGIGQAVPRGAVRYLRVCQEVRADLIKMPDGSYQQDHTPFMHWYAAPVDKIRGPHGWPSYVAKATWGIVPVEEDGSANFLAPAGKTLYFDVLDENFNEIQRMRSVVQVQPGEKRSCIGCHENRDHAPIVRHGIALRETARRLEEPPWGAGPLAYENVVQPVLNRRCTNCHDADDAQGINLTGTLDMDRIPASYRTLITQGWVHHFDWGYKAGNEKAEALTFGTVKSKLFQVLDKGHYDVKLTPAEMRALKCWVDLNCPLWPDYIFRENRPGPATAANVTKR